VSRPAAPRDARRARVAVTVVFGLNGLIYGSWAARIPAVRDRLHLGDGELGLALACIAVGAILAMPVAGGLAARHGSRIVTRAALALTCVVAAIVTAAPSPAVFAVLCVCFGATFGSLDVSMNAHGVAVENRFGRPILAGLHGAFSLGGLLGAGLGALAAGARIDVRLHLAAIAAASAVIGLLWSRRFLPGAEDATGRGDPMFVRPPRRLWALGGLAFACLLIEGATADWSAVYLRDELGASAAVAALGFTSFSVTMTLGRFFGDRLVERLGPVTLVRLGGLVAAGGFGLALLAGQPAAAMFGCACLGAGMASVVPIVFRAAGAVPGVTAGVALAAVSSTGYLGFVVGPPTIGGLAELIGLPTALGVLVALAAVVASLARTTRIAARPGAPASTEVALA
jgi:MFS family permease